MRPNHNYRILLCPVYPPLTPQTLEIPYNANVKEHTSAVPEVPNVARGVLKF